MIDLVVEMFDGTEYTYGSFQESMSEALLMAEVLVTCGADIHLANRDGSDEVTLDTDLVKSVRFVQHD